MYITYFNTIHHYSTSFHYLQDVFSRLDPSMSLDFAFLLLNVFLYHTRYSSFIIGLTTLTCLTEFSESTAFRSLTNIFSLILYPSTTDLTLRQESFLKSLSGLNPESDPILQSYLELFIMSHSSITQQSPFTYQPNSVYLVKRPPLSSSFRLLYDDPDQLPKS